MYAVIATGGKQYRVEEGQRLEVEWLGPDAGADVELAPVLVVDGDRVLATPAQLEAASVRGRVVGAARGPKIRGFTYKPKTNQRRRWGHRQRHSVLEITTITAGGSKAARSTRATKPAAAPAEPTAKKAGGTKKAPAKKSTTKKAPAKKAPAKKSPAKGGR